MTQQPESPEGATQGLPAEEVPELGPRSVQASEFGVETQRIGRVQVSGPETSFPANGERLPTTETLPNSADEAGTFQSNEGSSQGSTSVPDAEENIVSQGEVVSLPFPDPLGLLA